MRSEFRAIHFGGTAIPYRTRTGKRRSTIRLAVEPDGAVEITAPEGTDDRRVAEMVRRKAPWILSQWRRQSRVQTERPPRQFVSGESVLYLGRTYQFRLRSRAGNHGTMSVLGGRICFEVPRRLSARARRNACRKLLIAWLRERAVLHGARVCDRIRRQLGLGPVEVKVRELGSRWGSCTSKGRVLLNWRTVMAPLALFEYVCAHEVCHLLVADHSPEFRRLLDRVQPKWRERHRRLATIGARLDL